MFEMKIGRIVVKTDNVREAAAFINLQTTGGIRVPRTKGGSVTVNKPATIPKKKVRGLVIRKRWAKAKKLAIANGTSSRTEFNNLGKK